MSRPEILRQEKSGLDRFLFAGIGAEADGSFVSVLSILARLGHDPWMTAARWAAMPREGAGDALAACIVQMPLSAQDIGDAPATADRLIRLLSGAGTLAADATLARTPAARSTTPLAHLAVTLAVMLGLSLLAMLVSRPGPVAMPAAHAHAHAHAYDHGSVTSAPIGLPAARTP